VPLEGLGCQDMPWSPGGVVSPVVHVRGGIRDVAPWYRGVSWTKRRIPSVYGSSWLHPSLACLHEGGTGYSHPTGLRETNISDFRNDVHAVLTTRRESAPSDRPRPEA
jgi:hypothetical protein